MLRSIVEYYAEHEGYKCGYCGSPNTNFSHGMWAHSLTVADYQDLIDRGWRRSGKYCYKPTMDVTCCPMYTIRCRVLEFKASKSQKKILKRFNKFLSGEEVLKDRKMSTGSSHKMSTGSSHKMSTDSSHKMSTDSSDSASDDNGERGAELFVESTIKPQDINVDDVMKTEVTKEVLDQGPEVESEVMLESKETSSKPDLKHPTKDLGPDPNKAPCKKAKQLRRERTLEKLRLKGIDIDSLPANQNKEKKIEDFLNELPDELTNKLEIKLVRTNPPSVEYLATAKETHNVFVKYQTKIHNDTLEKCAEPKFQDFLVASPLLEEHPSDGPPLGYGSFHQQYWLSGKLIAVGVIDILPKCVSSVYFFYDPQYMNLTLGTYGALREIDFTRQLHKKCPNLQYYYMGYYIHSCRKMRYKGYFSPSDLVCPETYKWFPLKESIPKLETCPYSRLDDNLDNVDENYPKETDINFIPCWVKGTIMPYKMYKRKMSKRNNDDEIVQYSQLVGAKSIKNIILVRPKVK